MTQYVINIGAIPNDGTGDPLRTAFNETNLNFNQVFAAGPVLSNIRIANNTILTTTTNGNLILAPNGIGRIQANATIVPSVANVRDLGSATQRWNTVYTQYLDLSGVLTTGDLIVDGNLTVQGNTIQIGNIVTDTKTIQLANTASNASSANGAGITVGVNDNIATLLYNNTGNTWTTNIGISSVGNITAPYFVGNGSLLTGLAVTYGNANVATFLANFGSNTISTTGNITSNGLVNVNRLRVNQTANAWSIAGNIISAPSGGSWNSDPEFLDEYITSAPDGYINLTSLYANSNVASQVHLEHGLAQIVVDNGSQYIWEFDDSGNLTVPGNIIPAANAVYSLGNSTNYWSNLWVANNTIYIGGVALGITAGNVLTVNGNAVLTNGSNTAVSTTGNITAGNIGITGGSLTWANASIVQTSASDVSITGDGQVTVRSLDGTYQWTFESTGNLTLPGATAGETIATQGGYITVGNLLIGQGGALFNSNNDSWALYGNLSDPGATILIPSNADAGNGTPLYIESQQSNVEIRSGSSTWNFDTTGNLTLPGNTFAVNYANGGPVTFTANTGNVTFSGEAVIGTGTSNTQSGLYLAPDPVSLTNDLYLRVRGNILDEPTHIHFDTGNNQYYNLIIGDDNKYVQLANTGNIVINTNNYAGNTAQWNFDYNGNLTLPLGGVVSEGASPTGLGNTIALTPAGGSDADQQLLMYPTGNVMEGNHLHLTTGNLYNTELYLGNDNLYVKLANTGAVVINSYDGVGNAGQWTFGTDSNLTTPGGMIINGNINTLGSQTALLQPTDDLPLAFIASGANGSVISYWAEDIANLMSSNIAAIYTPLQGTQTVRIVTGTNGGNIAIYDFDKNGVFSTAQVSATGNVTGNYFIGNGSLLTGISASLPVANGTSNFDIATANGNVTITANAETYTFGTNSTLTLPGGSRLRPLGANLDIFAGTGSYVNLITSDESSYMGVAGSGGYVTTAGGTWNFSTNGNLTAPGNISAVGNVTSGNLTVGSGTITGGNVNGAVFNGNVAFGTGTVGGSGNITGGNLITTGSGGAITMSGGNITGAGNIAAGNVSTTGNITAANFFGNGNTLSNVATTFESTWTVPTGNSTQSFTVTPNNTYYMWVDCNIPNGILTWNATVTVTNTNVPVVGAQYAWVYDGGGTPIDFTSIPNQFIGTSNTIVRSSVAPSATTNRFDFGINNASGNSQTVRYGWAQIS